jgi:hypothetical protein
VLFRSRRKRACAMRPVWRRWLIAFQRQPMAPELIRELQEADGIMS